jgi:chemotaxis protein methyltransferase CheR
VRVSGKSERLDEATLSRLEEVLRAACGVVLASGVRRSLGTALSRTCEALGVSREACLQQLLAREPATLESFLGFAVIGETYFFRHPEHLRELARQAAASPEPFRVWCAGCASGEEPYSVAMMLRAAGVPAERLRVMGTDVSIRALARARRAVYSSWSVRRIEPELERRFLVSSEEGISVAPEVRPLVEFRRHNLITDRPPLFGVQAVLCRNVLIYFPPELIPGVLDRLVSALAPGGLLLLSPAEVPLARGLGLEEVEAEGVPLLRMPQRKAPRRDTPPAPLRLVTPLPLPATRPPAKPLPLARRTPVPAPAQPPAPAPSLLEQARAAAQAGDHARAESLAREAARALSPEAYLLLALVAEARGDAPAAVEAVRKALYLDPQMALAHAMLVPLFERLGQHEEAERARRNALRVLEGVDDEQVLRGVEEMTAGGLRRALAPGMKQGKSGAR